MTTPSHPISLDQLRQRALTHIDNRQWAAAQAALETVLQHAPSDLASSIQLADVLFRQGHLQASTWPLLQALRSLPRDVPLITDLVQHLIARGEIVAARSCLDLLAQAPNPPARVWVVQANLRFMIGEVREALALIEKAVRAGADAPAELHLYAMLLQFNGQMDAARKVLEDCLVRWPHFGDAAAILVDLHKQTPDGNHLALLREQLERLPEQPTDTSQAFVRAEFEYATFKTLGDLGRHEEAWQALARCNALMHQLNPYLREAEEATTDALIGMPLNNYAATADAVQPEGPTPIFIVGMPRSGTTLLERILSSHSKVTSAGEITDFWRQLHWVADVVPDKTRSLRQIAGRERDIDYHQLGQRYLKQTQWRAQGRAYYVDKMPGNIQMVAFIRRALPHAPILHMARDPMDTCFSNFKAMFGNASPYSYDLEALAHYYLQYRRLVRHWHDALPGAMLDVSYADLVQESTRTVHQVLAHCGLEVEEACLRPERNAAPVATRSSPQVRESIHTRGLDQWRHYAEQLEPVRAALADHNYD
jgi:tetratricopeptide (TPR) repeat protein